MAVANWYSIRIFRHPESLRGTFHSFPQAFIRLKFRLKEDFITSRLSRNNLRSNEAAGALACGFFILLKVRMMYFAGGFFYSGMQSLTSNAGL
jgi:hypothetical protein